MDREPSLCAHSRGVVLCGSILGSDFARVTSSGVVPELATLLALVW
jgi:hypothetical protein